jgi:hypothetical protein
MEIKTNEIQDLVPVIITNYDELKKELTEKTESYKSIVYTEDTIKDAKTDRANLNNLEKAINAEKIRVKNIFLKPFEDFETKCKELMAMVNEASGNIDKQIKVFESKQDEEKTERIKEIFNQYVGEYKDLVTLSTIFNDRWLNKTFSIKKVEEDIAHIFSKLKMDLGTIEGQIDNPTLLKQVKDFYFQNIDKVDVLSLSLNEKNRILENQVKIEKLENDTKKLVEELKEENAELVAERNTLTFDFRIHATKEQLTKLKAFLVENNIKVERI